MKNLIGISGKMGSGKDTVGYIVQYLTDPYAKKNNLSFEQWLDERSEIAPGYVYTESDWELKKYADKLKDIVCMLIGCTRKQLEDNEFKNAPLNSDWDDSHGISTPRELLQVLGTDCGRDMIHTNIWTNALFADYKPIGGKMIANPKPEHLVYPSWIITDMRFPNELSYIKAKGGITIRVNTTRFIYNGKVSNHVSETALDNSTFDYVIDNSGTFDELVEHVREILVREGVI